MSTAGRVLHLPPLPTLKEVIHLYKLRAMKQLSQNFLLNPRLLNRFVKCAGKLDGGHACEVGPGPGGITREILHAGVKKLIVIEKDNRFMPGLQMLNEASGGRIEIHHGDIMKFNMSRIFPLEEANDWLDKPPNLHILGNLPFSVATPLIIKWMEDISNHTGAWNYGRVKLTLTFQQEVAERIIAPVNHEQRTRLSIMCQYLCNVSHKFTIRGKAFLPPPDVDVGVVHFTPRKEPLIKAPFKMVEKVVRHTFSFPPKMCKRGVETLFPPDMPGLTRQMFSLADVSPEVRPRQLSMEEFARLITVYKYICLQNPGLIDYYYRTPENAIEWRKNKVPLNL